MSNLTRYKFNTGFSYHFGVGVVEDDEGEYVKFDDIKEFLKPTANKQSKTVTIGCTCGKRMATVHLCDECFRDAVTA